MFYLYHEHYDPNFPKFSIIKEQKDIWLQNYILYENLKTILESSLQYTSYQHIFLLDDQRFSFFYFPIKKTVDSTITLSDIQTLISQKITQTEQKTKETFLFSMIDSILVNDKPQKRLIGKKWEISCILTLVYINRQTSLIFNDFYADFSKQKNIKVLPKHFYTIDYLASHLQVQDFLILNIEESATKAIQIKSGKYQTIQSINLWTDFLMQMYKENGISKYRYKSASEIDQNTFAKNIVIQTLNDYSNLLCKRLKEIKIWWSTIFLISPIMKNSHFMDTLNQIYNQDFTSYIVPLHIPPEINQFNKKREIQDINPLIYLNLFHPEEKPSL